MNLLFVWRRQGRFSPVCAWHLAVVFLSTFALCGWALQSPLRRPKSRHGPLPLPAGAGGGGRPWTGFAYIGGRETRRRHSGLIAACAAASSSFDDVVLTPLGLWLELPGGGGGDEVDDEDEEGADTTTATRLLCEDIEALATEAAEAAAAAVAAGKEEGAATEAEAAAGMGDSSATSDGAADMKDGGGDERGKEAPHASSPQPPPFSLISAVLFRSLPPPQTVALFRRKRHTLGTTTPRRTASIGKGGPAPSSSHPSPCPTPWLLVQNPDGSLREVDGAALGAEAEGVEKMEGSGSGSGGGGGGASGGDGRGAVVGQCFEVTDRAAAFDVVPRALAAAQALGPGAVLVLSAPRHDSEAWAALLVALEALGGPTSHGATVVVRVGRSRERVAEAAVGLLLGQSGGLPTLGVESLQDRGDEGREDEGSEVEGCNSRGGSLGKGWGSTGGALLLPLDVGLWRAGALFALGGV